MLHEIRLLTDQQELITRALYDAIATTQKVLDAFSESAVSDILRERKSELKNLVQLLSDDEDTGASVIITVKRRTP
jgi:hypothetical protein